MRYHVIRPRSGLRVATVATVVSLLGACSLLTPRGGDPDADDCRSFREETVQGVRWSPAGDYLAVATTDDDSFARVRVFRWPGMDLLSEATTDNVGSDAPAMDDQGVAYWVTEDVFEPDAPARLWRLEPGAEPSMAEAPVRRYVYGKLVWAGGAFLTDLYDPGPPARSRLVTVDLANPDFEPVGLTEWTTRVVGEYWADPSGEWLVWDEHDGVGEQQDFVVKHDGREQRVQPPGYGGRAMTLSPDHTSVVYQRSETARLTVLNLEIGEVDGELSQMEVFGGEVSSTGILAALTAHGPFEGNELCLLDVNARLASIRTP